MITFLKKAFVWLVLSSKDPQKVSLTIKGILGIGAMWAGYAIGFFHLDIPQGDLDSLSHSIQFFVDAFLAALPAVISFFSAAATLWGALRKIWTSFTGENRVLQELNEK